MWRDMCCALGLRPAVAETIAATYSGNPKQCLREVIIRWLRKTHDVYKHGPPTWRTLVKAVSDKAGGDNPALAEEIAKDHKGIVTILYLEGGGCWIPTQAVWTHPTIKWLYKQVLQLL